MRRSYQTNGDQGERDEVQDVLESYVREGAQQMLAAVLEEEVNAFLGRHRYQRGQRFRGYRNGYHPARELTVGLGPVAVRVPRVAQVPREVAPQGYHSGVVQRYQRASQTTQRLFARLYLEGLATGDFEPVFRELVGETTALSANTVVRLKEYWGGEYEAWRRRPLSPNPPKDTDGRREESGRGGEGATGEIAWVPFGVGRSADGLHRRTGAPMAVCGSCDARDGERIRSRELSRTGLARVCGDLRLSGGWVADGAVRPGVEWLAAGPRRG